jgi:hypothetical protein
MTDENFEVTSKIKYFLIVCYKETTNLSADDFSLCFGDIVAKTQTKSSAE